MSLKNKLLMLVVLPVVVCTTIAVLLSSIKLYNQGIENLTDKSNAILTQNIMEYVHNHVEGNSVLELNPTDVLHGITSKIDAASQTYIFRISSTDPIEEKHRAKPTDTTFINRFKHEKPDGLTHIDETMNTLWVMRPVYMDEKKGCMECHDAGAAGDGNFRGMFVVESGMQTLKADVNKAIVQNSFLGFLIMVIAILLGIWMVSRLSKAMTQIMKVSENVSEGSLQNRVEIKTNDELEQLGDYINKMVESLNSVLLSVQNAARELNGQTQEMGQNSSIIVKGAQYQKEQLQELAASIQKTIQNISIASDFIKKSEVSASIAEKSMNNTIASISNIEESSKLIYQEVQTINSIAFQTNILAINAAIEAARAGEHGKGFAVVASEVQKLSEITANSSKKINEVTSNSLKQVEEGVKITLDAGAKIKEIINMVSEISASLAKIADSARDQSEIMDKNAEITQQNATAAEELDASSSLLSQQADSLREIVSYFNLKK